LWSSTKFIGVEWTAPGWTRWSWEAWNAGNPDKPWACIRPGGPFAMPQIVFKAEE
jgi:hypothetical protein